MKKRSPSVTTRTGDSGTSADRSGTRDWKDAALFRTLGTPDELNSFVGVAKHHAGTHDELIAVQRTLQELGSPVATDPITAPELHAQLPLFGEDRIDLLEVWQRTMLGEIELGREFVLPGATPASAHVDVARAVCRRAEREMVAFLRDTPRPDLETCLRWLNRLSDVLFVLARRCERPVARA